MYSSTILGALQADVMLVKNAQNLMKAVIQTIEAAESAYVKVSITGICHLT